MDYCHEILYLKLVKFLNTKKILLYLYELSPLLSNAEKSNIFHVCTELSKKLLGRCLKMLKLPNINFQNSKYTLFVTFICYSQNIRHQGATCLLWTSLKTYLYRINILNKIQIEAKYYIQL